MEANRSVKAFDTEVIHAGNRGLRIDHASISVEVDALLGGLSLEQKIHELHGWQMEPIDGFYYAGGDAALGIKPWKMADGPRGARVGKATAFPVAIARGATFDPELERRVGMAAGAEIAAKGGNVILAPTINLLRHPGWGRAQETYSEDTHHMGAMGVAYISGAQNWVLTSPKHFALNNLEMTRFQMSANANERVLHEVYLPHFKRCVVEGAAASVMSAYNRVNGVYCGEHPILLTDILREDWGFKGFVESDWILGTRSTAKAINAGMDIEMPVAYRFEREKIDAALSGGELDEAVITRNARRSLYQKLAWDIAGMDRPDASVVECEAHLELAREAAEKSFVLL
ncbi:MAG: glycoside hydrolase family 3 protein, partial [Pseudomonadales bacterium]